MVNLMCGSKLLTMIRDQGNQIPPIYAKSFPPMPEPFHHQDISRHVIKACRGKSKRHKFQKQCSKVSTIYYYHKQVEV